MDRMQVPESFNDYNHDEWEECEEDDDHPFVILWRLLAAMLAIAFTAGFFWLLQWNKNRHKKTEEKQTAKDESPIPEDTVENVSSITKIDIGDSETNGVVVHKQDTIPTYYDVVSEMRFRKSQIIREVLQSTPYSKSNSETETAEHQADMCIAKLQHALETKKLTTEERNVIEAEICRLEEEILEKTNTQQDDFALLADKQSEQPEVYKYNMQEQLIQPALLTRDVLLKENQQTSNQYSHSELMESQKTKGEFIQTKSSRNNQQELSTEHLYVTAQNKTVFTMQNEQWVKTDEHYLSTETKEQFLVKHVQPDYELDEFQQTALINSQDNGFDQQQLVTNDSQGDKQQLTKQHKYSSLLHEDDTPIKNKDGFNSISHVKIEDITQHPEQNLVEKGNIFEKVDPLLENDLVDTKPQQVLYKEDVIIPEQQGDTIMQQNNNNKVRFLQQEIDAQYEYSTTQRTKESSPQKTEDLSFIGQQEKRSNVQHNITGTLHEHAEETNETSSTQNQPLVINRQAVSKQPVAKPEEETVIFVRKEKVYETASSSEAESEDIEDDSGELITHSSESNSIVKHQLDIQFSDLRYFEESFKQTDGVTVNQNNQDLDSKERIQSQEIDQNDTDMALKEDYFDQYNIDYEPAHQKEKNANASLHQEEENSITSAPEIESFAASAMDQLESGSAAYEGGFYQPEDLPDDDKELEKNRDTVIDETYISLEMQRKTVELIQSKKYTENFDATNTRMTKQAVYSENITEGGSILDDTSSSMSSRPIHKKVLKKRSSILEILNSNSAAEALTKMQTLDEVSSVMRKAGLESSNLIFGIDYTASNKYQGETSFDGRSLHSIRPGLLNPYQQVISIVGKTLAPFATTGHIPVFGFGDITTSDFSVFPLMLEELGMEVDDKGYKRVVQKTAATFDDVLYIYNTITPTVTLSGPTNFAPLIYQSIEICKEIKDYHILVIVADGQVTNERATRRAIVEACEYPLSIIVVGVGDGPWDMMRYHILVIVADGQVTNERATRRAIVEACEYPLSIIVVGVGDGPWDMMRVFDESLPKRPWDNFHFVEFCKIMAESKENSDLSFAMQSLMEIPDQYKIIKKLGLL